MPDRSRHRLFAIPLCAVSLVVMVAATSGADVIRFPTPKGGPAEELFDKGIGALARSDLAGAEAAFKGSLKIDAKAAGSVLGLAQVAAKRGDRKAFGAYLQQAFQLAPDSPEVQADWGRYKYSEGRFDEAETAYRAAIHLDPKAVSPRVDLADLRMTVFKKPGEAIALYKEAIGLQPQHAGAHYALGVALATSGDEAGAIAALNKAASLAPANPLPAYQLGRLHESKKRFDQALDAFAKAVQIAPSFAPAMLERGNILMERRDDAGALREFRAAAGANPKLAEPQIKIGMVSQRREQWTEAESAYRAAIALDRNQAVAYNNLAWMAAERKVNLNDALAWAQKATSLAPGISPFQTTLGWVYRARGDLKKAVATLAKAAATQPERAEAFYYLGVAQIEQGERSAGVASLRKALAIDPAFAKADAARQHLKGTGGA